MGRVVDARYYDSIPVRNAGPHLHGMSFSPLAPLGYMSESLVTNQRIPRPVVVIDSSKVMYFIFCSDTAHPSQGVLFVPDDWIRIGAFFGLLSPGNNDDSTRVSHAD